MLCTFSWIFFEDNKLTWNNDHFVSIPKPLISIFNIMLNRSSSGDYFVLFLTKEIVRVAFLGMILLVGFGSYLFIKLRKLPLSTSLPGVVFPNVHL